MQYKALARKKKEMKEAGIKDISVITKPLTALEIQRFQKHTNDVSIQDIATEEGVAFNSVLTSIKKARKKMGISVVSTQNRAN